MEIQNKLITPQEALEIIKKAAEALSHSSYCGVVGIPPNKDCIYQAWDPLRELIHALEPDNFLIMEGEEFLKPTLKISVVDSYTASHGPYEDQIQDYNENPESYELKDLSTLEMEEATYWENEHFRNKPPHPMIDKMVYKRSDTEHSS